MKIIKVESCEKCPYYIRPMFSRSLQHCQLLDHPFDKREEVYFDVRKIFPECPLEDYKE